MMTNNAFENLLRAPWEWMVTLCAVLLALLIAHHPYLFALSPRAANMTALLFVGFGIVRFLEGLKIYCYKKRLLTLKFFSMGPRDIPFSKKQLFLGKGFRWLPIHRQRLHLLNQVENQSYQYLGKLKQAVLSKAREKPKSIYALLTKIPFTPFKSMPEIGGKPFIHGVGSDEEKNICIPQANRHSHMIVFGMTRVGKTRLMSNLLNQDIRNGEAVLVIDPKGDLELLQDMFAACKVANRVKDFVVLHAGIPELSAKYNPLASFVNISEVATRVAGAIQAEGEGKQFRDFAWKFLNIVVTCLHEMNQTISYASLAFYITRPKELLFQYCESHLSKHDPDYIDAIETLLAENSNKIDKKGHKTPGMTPKEAAQMYVADYISDTIKKGDKTIYDSIIVDLYDAANLGDEYYSKITASLGPVFDKINKTSAREVFSWDDANGLPVVTLDEVIREKKVFYIGLDSLSNADMANAIGQAIIADLVTLCGKLYRAEPDKKFPLCLHIDEFSNVVRDECINLLNKAGGAGIKVSAYTQTVNDLGAVFGSNKDKMKMLLGNFGTMVMLRVANRDTAETFTLCLEEINTRSSTPSTMSNDKSDNDTGELFTTYNTDTVNESSKSLIHINDLYALPKGQAFVLTDGGQVFKIRIPLPKNTFSLPNKFEAILKDVNT